MSCRNVRAIRLHESLSGHFLILLSTLKDNALWMLSVNRWCVKRHGPLQSFTLVTIETRGGNSGGEELGDFTFIDEMKGRVHILGKHRIQERSFY